MNSGISERLALSKATPEVSQERTRWSCKRKRPESNQKVMADFTDCTATLLRKI